MSDKNTDLSQKGTVAVKSGIAVNARYKDGIAVFTLPNGLMAGMEQYIKEIALQKNEENTLGLDSSNFITKKHKDKGKGFDLSI